MSRRRSNNDAGAAAGIFVVLLVIAFVIKFWPWILGALLLWWLIKFGLPAGQRAIREMQAETQAETREDRPPQRRTGGPLRPAARGPDERRHHTRHVRRVPATGWSEVKRNEYAEPTEMAGVAEAETEVAYAWALDYDDHDDSRRTAADATAHHVAGHRGEPSHDRGSQCCGSRCASSAGPSSAPASAVETVTRPMPPSPVTVTVQAAALPTYDPSPANPGWPTDPRFNYGSALPHDSRFSYGVVPGGPCGMATKEFGYTTEASGGGAIATCNHDTWTWILVSQDSFRFDGVHSRGSRCDGSGAAMSLEGRHMTCVTGANAIGTWQEDR